MKKMFNLSKDLNDRIINYSKNQGITQSQTVENILRAYFDGISQDKQVLNTIKEKLNELEQQTK